MANIQTEKIEIIYVAKMIGLFFVTLGHGGLTSPAIRDLIYSFHMPLFFLLSGFLYKERTLKDSIIIQWRRILVPYLLINGIIFLYYLVYSMIIDSFDYNFVYSSIGSVFLGLGYNIGIFKPLSTPTWFFVVLFFSHILMAVCRTTRSKVLAVLICLILYKCLNTMNYDTFIPFDSTMIAFPFVVIGYFCKRLITPPYNRWGLMFSTQMWVLPIMAILLLLLHIVNGRIDINTCKTGNSLILMYINGVLGTLIVLKLSKRFVNSASMASVFASGGMLIVGFNLIAINYAKKIWSLLTNYPIDETVGFMIGIIILLVFYPVIIFCKKHFKIILGNRQIK